MKDNIGIEVPWYRGRLTEVNISIDWRNEIHDLGVMDAALGSYQLLSWVLVLGGRKVSVPSQS